jgi:hypothetical protein
MRAAGHIVPQTQLFFVLLARIQLGENIIRIRHMMQRSAKISTETYRRSNKRLLDTFVCVAGPTYQVHSASLSLVPQRHFSVPWVLRSLQSPDHDDRIDLIACERSTFGNDCILSSFFSFILTSNKFFYRNATSTVI